MNTYVITVEVDDVTPLTAADVDRITDELESFHPALGHSTRGFRSVTLSVPGGNIRQALASAVAVVEDAFADAAIAVEALTEPEFDVRQGWVATPELVSVSQAAELLGVSRQRVLQRIQERTLPATQVGSAWVIARSAVESSSEATSPRVPS